LSSHLPCKKCGNGLPIVRGSAAQCPYCGTKTFYMESIYSFKHFLRKILKLKTHKNKIKIKEEELEIRKFSIKNFYRNIYSDFNDYRHLIITKLDNIDINPVKLFNVIRTAGNLILVIEKFLIPFLSEEKTIIEYQEYRDHLFIMNKSLLGLFFTYYAKETNYIKNCIKFYKLAEENYQNIVDFCKITKFEEKKSKVNKYKPIYSILVEFTIILRKILNKNPRYFSDKLVELIKKLDNLNEKSIQIYNLYDQINQIYQLERDTYTLLEKVKLNKQLMFTESLEDNIILTDENLDKLNHIRNWIEETSVAYQEYQANLLKLHSGRLIKYLESYRDEFINYKKESAEQFDNILGEMINGALEAYNSESIEALDILSQFMQKNIYKGGIIKRFEIEHEDLIQMEESLKKVIEDLFKKPILRNFESDYYKKLISLISGKHTEFDKYILKFIHRIFEKFEEIRFKRLLSLTEQRSQFSSKYKPCLKKLIDLSFTLNEEVLQYPLFIDIDIQNKNLKVNNPEIITLYIENPSPTDIKDVNIYFFMPNSLQSKMNSTSIKRLKGNEIRKIKTRITPKEKGFFLCMVMIEYQHTNKTYWMPSIKFELDVEEEVKFTYHPSVFRKTYESELTAAKILNYSRNYS